jgi:O-antigen/teichoic acid export membrane protein
MLKNIVSNWVTMITTLAVAFTLLPIMLHDLGQEQYGLWLLITSMTGYLGLMNLGIPMASVFFIAKYDSDKNYDSINSIVANSVVLYFIIALASLLIGSGMLFAFERVYSVPPALRGSSQIAFAVVLINIAIGFLSLVPQAVLQAYHAFVPRNIVTVSVLVTRLILTIGILKVRPDLYSLAFVQLICTIMEISCLCLAIRRLFPHIQLRLSFCSWNVVRQIFSFSIFVLILGLGVQLMFLTDSVVIGKFLSFSQIPFYSVPNTLTTYLMEFLVGIAAVVMPIVTNLHSHGDASGLRTIFLKWSKNALSLTLLAGLYLFVFGPGFIRLWVGDTFYAPSGGVLKILMFSFFFFLPVRAVCVPVLTGIGRPGRPAVSFLIAGVLNLILSILFVRPWGINGVAWGTAIPNMLFAITVLVFTCREIGVTIFEYLTYTFIRPAMGAIPVVLFLLTARKVFDASRYMSLGAAGLSMFVFFSIVWIYFVYRNDRYTDIHMMLSKYMGRQNA